MAEIFNLNGYLLQIVFPQDSGVLKLSKVPMPIVRLPENMLIDAHTEEVNKRPFVIFTNSPKVLVSGVEGDYTSERESESLFGIGVLGFKGVRDRYQYAGERVPSYLLPLLNKSEQEWHINVIDYALYAAAASSLFQLLSVALSRLVKKSDSRT